ncbi:hypothetical protein ZTR_09467 [Talaromyces verruculosus]|nr:hypothetical protein ZTR_09467 [Talaromyces verruculosus]
MVEYAERGNPILSHDDVPEYIREEIIRVEEQHKIRTKKSHHPGSSYPPINITNVLPTSTTSVSHQSTTNNDFTSAPTARFESTDRLNVHGSLDQAVHDYTEYKISHATNDTWKEGFRRAGDIAIQKGFDLDLLYKTGTKVFDGHDILEGLVKQYVRDIKFWIENYHQGNKGV